MSNEILRAEADIQHIADASICQCPACAAVAPETQSDQVDASLDPFAGGTVGGKSIWTVEQVAAHFNRTGGGFANGFGTETGNGRQNNIGDGADVITFGFFNTQAQVINNGYTYVAPNAQGVATRYGLAEVFNFAAMTTAQRDATREAMQSWDDVVAVSFREVSADDADMNFGNLASAPTTQAYARIPTAGLDATLGGQVREIGGDSWISASQASNFQLDEGGYGIHTLLHEAGHSIGLSHPGAYNGTGAFATDAEYAQDTRSYSVMSYFDARFSGGRHFDFGISTTVYAAVPMIHDIAAAQAIYGADLTTRTGDTVYGFNSNAGRDSFDFVKTPAPIGAIWDAGGIDTIDASGYGTDQLIDLAPGSLSSIGGVTFENAPSLAQVNANRAALGLGPVPQASYDANMAALKANAAVGRLVDNFGIAYGVTIENAIGGSGADTLLGNKVDNVLTGNAGNDMIGGGAGNDTLDGGLGDDVMLGGTDDDLYIVGEAGDIVTELADAGTDTVRSAISYALGDNVENLELTGDAVTGTGNALGNQITGTGGANQLSGGAGDDLLIGGAGADVLDGGAGFDTASYRDAKAGVTVSFANNGKISVTGGDTGDTLISIEAIEGSNFADTFRGGNYNDVLFGLDGNDTMFGDNGNDMLDGGADNDRLDGGNANDDLFGRAGADTLLGGNGNDVLDGGGDADVLTGGNGNDRFVFQSAAEIGALGGAHDRITDFQTTFDTIDLSALFGSAEAAAGAELRFDGNRMASIEGASARAYDVSVYSEGGKTFVVGDVTGDGIADFGLELNGTLKLKARDFVLAEAAGDAGTFGAQNGFQSLNGDLML